MPKDGPAEPCSVSAAVWDSGSIAWQPADDFAGQSAVLTAAESAERWDAGIQAAECHEIAGSQAAVQQVADTG